MKCPHCNKKINLKIKLCPYCGKIISKQKLNGAKRKANGKAASTYKSSTKDDNGIYWASKESDKFHRPSCEWAQEIIEPNLIIYYSRKEAIDDGREPCHVCYP